MRKKILNRVLWPLLLFMRIYGDTHSGETDPALRRRSASVFPILMYNSDIGTGFGGKGAVRNALGRSESIDVMLFGSSKGEQNYTFFFSMPDFELRQGKPYALALDLNLSFEKLLKSNFFGIGNGTRDNEFQFPKEQNKAECVLSRAFRSIWIGEAGYRFTTYSAYGYDPSWGMLNSSVPGAGESVGSSVFAGLRFDTRDSQINPHLGVRLYGTAEFSLPSLGSDWNYRKYRMEAGGYAPLLGNHVAAARLWIQHVSGDAPYFELSKVGDSWTGRGYKSGRFLDRAMALASLEYRFPLYRKLGGVAFIDAGRVAPGMKEIRLSGWHTDWGLGLRYYLADFVVRLDVGNSAEGTRLFFMFGQVF